MAASDSAQVCWMLHCIAGAAMRCRTRCGGRCRGTKHTYGTALPHGVRCTLYGGRSVVPSQRIAHASVATSSVAHGSVVPLHITQCVHRLHAVHTARSRAPPLISCARSSVRRSATSLVSCGGTRRVGTYGTQPVLNGHSSGPAPGGTSRGGLVLELRLIAARGVLCPLRHGVWYTL